MIYEYENIDRIDLEQIHMDVNLHTSMNKDIVSCTWHEDTTIKASKIIKKGKKGLLLIEYSSELNESDKKELDTIVKNNSR